jgi:hypothetical protein
LSRLRLRLAGNNVKGRKIVYRHEEVAEGPKNEIFAIF